MICKVVSKDNKLYAIKDEETLLEISNAWIHADGFHLVHGWYLYPNPLNIDLEYEIECSENNKCRIIKEKHA